MNQDPKIFDYGRRNGEVFISHRPSRSVVKQGPRSPVRDQARIEKLIILTRIDSDDNNLERNKGTTVQYTWGWYSP